MYSSMLSSTLEEIAIVNKLYTKDTLVIAIYLDWSLSRGRILKTVTFYVKFYCQIFVDLLLRYEEISTTIIHFW